MEEKILDFLDNDKAKTIKEIYAYLNVSSDQEKNEINNILNKNIKMGVVHETVKKKYILLKYCKSLRVGKVDATAKGYAFLIMPNADDIFINRDNLNGAINGDTVLIDTFVRHERPEGKVLKILDRQLKRVIGEILYKDNEPTLILDDKRLNINVKLNNHFANLVDGHKVLVNLDTQIDDNNFIGTVVKIIGHKNDPDIDILSIAYSHNIELEFSNKVKEELKSIPDCVREEDKLGRVDLTKEEIFTIDGDDTKDIDDAISLKDLKDCYELGVHIADVSYYVKPNTNLYNAAYERGTSSYLADKVLPMLPHELSNGICSLNPDVERLAISVVMKIDKNNGKVKEYDIFPSIIKSRKQMTYKCVNKIIRENIVPEGYEEFKNTLLEMQKLSTIIRKRMISEGYLEFEIPEPKIIQDENGKCIDILKREQLEGESLIENFMIMANETVATHIFNMDLPFIYRVHGTPRSEKIDDFINLLKILKINVDTKDIGTKNRNMQNILKELKEYNENSILASMLLRSMQKAIYSTDNIGHFGLGLKNYTHFTSPIRRFPDTTVHMLLRTYLFNKQIDNETIKYFNSILPDIALHSSEKEQDATEAEREVDDMKMAEYMESHIGEEYEGVITTVTNFGFFVQLSNLVEGLVHINSLNGYYEYVPELLSLISQDKKNKYCIGDKVKIRVVNASKDAKLIDFEVINGNSK